MAEARNQSDAARVEAFPAAVEPPAKREDAPALDALFRRVTAEEPVMEGAALIGYGAYETVYASGRAVRWMRRGNARRSISGSANIPKAQAAFA